MICPFIIRAIGSRLDNPDFVETVPHSYWHRADLVAGDLGLRQLAQRL